MLFVPNLPQNFLYLKGITRQVGDAELIIPCQKGRQVCLADSAFDGPKPLQYHYK